MGDEIRVLTFNGGLCGEIRSSECANSEKMSKMVDSCCWANGKAEERCDLRGQPSRLYAAALGH